MNEPDAEGGGLRLDEVLVRRGLVGSRARGKRAVLAGWVYVDGEVVRKPSKKVGVESEVEVRGGERYVSRGGEKLAVYLEAYGVEVEGKECLDVGASTGGFVDCLLQGGARKVVGVDVGRAQMAEVLREDERVVNIEGVHVLDMDSEVLGQGEFDMVVMDVSFISALKVLEKVWGFVKAGGMLIFLVKPQFEVGKAEIDRCGGVVKDVGVREGALEGVLEFCEARLGRVYGEAVSVEGTDGNVEYMVGVKKALLKE